MLVKTAGVRHLIVLINKMDDPTVEWDLERYGSSYSYVYKLNLGREFTGPSETLFSGICSLIQTYLRLQVSHNHYRNP